MARGPFFGSLLFIVFAPADPVAPELSTGPAAPVAPMTPVAPMLRGREDVASALQKLEGGSAIERQAAQRWLGAHLSRADFPEVAGALRSGGVAAVEVARRLVDAIASDDAHLGLAVLLATDRDEVVERAGRDAILELFIRWNPAALEPPGRRRNLAVEWREEADRSLSFDPRGKSFAEAIDQLARTAPGPAPIVLDPTLDPEVLRTGGDAAPRGELRGIWGEVLSGLVRLQRASFEVLGYRTEGPDRPFVRVCKRGDESEGHAGEHVTEWCRGVLRESDANWNTACARALGSLGWPAAIQWLEERWLAESDDAALEGLLAAAARGRVAPAFADPVILSVLLEGTDARLAQGGGRARAERVARALARVGPTAIDGNALALTFLDGWDELSPEMRWVRLVALEPYPGGSDRARDVAYGVFTNSEQPPALRFQALRTLSVGGARSDALLLRNPARLFTWAAGAGELEELAERLVAARVAVPEGDWTNQLPRDSSIGFALLEWAVATGADDLAATWIDELAGRGGLLDPLADRLRLFAGLGRAGRVRALVAAARERAEGDAAVRMGRLALRAGLLSRDEERATLDRMIAERDSAQMDDFEDFAVLAASETVGWRAREVLVVELRTGRDPKVLGPVLDRAARCLVRARRDDELQAFASRLRRIAIQVDHPLKQTLERGSWPPPAVEEPLRLELEDRWLRF